MKIRNGFVSNSSSSSFVVTVKDWLAESAAKRNGEKSESRISKKQIAKLEDYGFKWASWPCYPSQIEAGVKPKKKGGKNILWYKVVCNEDEVIEFLVKNRIPFEASCHYGHESVFYNGIGDSYKAIPNLGMVVEMYGETLGLAISEDGVEIRKVENEDS